MVYPPRRTLHLLASPIVSAHLEVAWTGVIIGPVLLVTTIYMHHLVAQRLHHGLPSSSTTAVAATTTSLSIRTQRRMYSML